jgi:hypothetical protein
MKLLEIISEGFNVTDQLLIRFPAFLRYWRRNGSKMKRYICCLKKACASVRGEVLYNILIKFGLLLKLIWLIKMCLNKHTVKSLQVNICLIVFLFRMV